MHQTSTIQSPTRSSPMHPRNRVEKQVLHPVLQIALASVDVHLDEEMLRYRRQRALGKTGCLPRSRAKQASTPSLEILSIPPAAEPALPASIVAQFHPTATVPPLAAIATPRSESSHSPNVELKQLAQQYATQVATSSDQAASITSSPDDYLESSEELLRTLSQEQAHVQAEQSFIQSLLTPLGFGSMLLLLMSSALFGFVIMNPEVIPQLFADQTNQSGANVSGVMETNRASTLQPNLAEQEFPEIKLGQLGSLSLEQHLTLPGSPSAASVKPTPHKTTSLGASGVASTTTPPTPKVSSSSRVAEPIAPSEAGDIPSPRKLAPAPSVPVSVAPNYEPPPVRAYTPPARDYTPPARAYSPPSPIKPYSPPSVAVRSTPKVVPVPLPSGDRTPLPPAPPAAASLAPSPTNSSGYKVVAPYTSDKVLDEYRGKVPDAYVKNYSDGAKVQFGAYQDESTAKSQVEELQKQGIPAEVYKP